MRKGQKRWGAAVAALLIVGAGVAYLRHRGAHHAAETPAEIAEDSDSRRWRGFPAGLPPTEAPAPVADGAAASPGWLDQSITKQQLEAAMDAWRAAILEKNADTVLSLDRVFSLLPGRYGPELVRLAESDPDERVRAFSTRVLGKLKNVELAEVFTHLLFDKSPFVRQNSAWALGELAALPRGRDAVMPAFDDLRRVQNEDPAPQVREAATNALKRLQ